MKQFILFLVMVLNTGMLYSQTRKESKSDILEGKQVGDTLTGKGVKYKLYRDSENDLFVLQNLANQDSTGLREVYPDDKIDEYYIPREVSVKLATDPGTTGYLQTGLRGRDVDIFSIGTGKNQRAGIPV